MSAPVPQDGVAYPLHVGASMTGDVDASSFTLLRFDFKPASVDPAQAGELVLGGARGAGAARATFPQQGAGRPPVAFEGSHAPCRDEGEAVLIFDGQAVRIEALAGTCTGLRPVRAAGAGAPAAARAVKRKVRPPGTVAAKKPRGKAAAKPAAAVPHAALAAAAATAAAPPVPADGGESSSDSGGGSGDASSGDEEG